MKEEKKEFVKALSDALKIDSSSGVKSMEYIRSVKAKERSEKNNPERGRKQY